MLADEPSPVFSDSIVKLKEINKASCNDIDGQKELGGEDTEPLAGKKENILDFIRRQELEGE